jgi:hypothetical protein
MVVHGRSSAVADFASGFAFFAFFAVELIRRFAMSSRSCSRIWRGSRFDIVWRTTDHTEKQEQTEQTEETEPLTFILSVHSVSSCSIPPPSRTTSRYGRKKNMILELTGTSWTGTEFLTAEYAEYAEAGREYAFLSFPRISRIPRFNPFDDRASVQIFAACEQIG